MEINFICSECRKIYPIESLKLKCDCGGMLDIEEYNISLNNIDKNIFSLFRYKDALPFDNESNIWKDITMGEGLSPIVPLDSENENILLKVDYLMPTLSFKDRGAAVLISKAKELGVKKVIQDSSGNAGTSIAAYASRANIECDIYVPSNTSISKINQIKFHNANIHLIEGSRENTAAAAMDAVLSTNNFYASHVYNPLFYEGTKTFIFEIFEQLENKLPDILFLPVGNGTLVLGAYIGLKNLYDLKLIDNFPKIIAVQSENCAPIYNSFINNIDDIADIESTETLAEGIAIKNPMRGKQILRAIKETNGEIILAPENKILNTQNFLAKKGFFVEPTTAATVAGFLEYNNKFNISKNNKVLIPLCGSGLKTIK